MGTHLYVCEGGGAITLTVDGDAPAWATCPICAAALECARCPGAQLAGDAEPFAPARRVVYRCAQGHERVVALPEGQDLPETIHCTACDGMLLPRTQPT
ncbi:MAG TPA: hypothetical protein VHB21_15510 [Minicystis sp.]|nr:hypothetical protein [Minicystis sp.]